MKSGAEMSQVDWQSNFKDDLKEDESVLSNVTSSDIDCIIILSFDLSINGLEQHQEISKMLCM